MTPSPTMLRELADRVEAAAGPDRELDVLIWAHQLGYEPVWQNGCLLVGGEGVVGWIDHGEHSRNFYTNRSTIAPASIPAYTSSLDAVKALEAGAMVEVHWQSASPRWLVQHYLTADSFTQGHADDEGRARLAACLRSIAETLSSSETSHDH